MSKMSLRKLWLDRENASMSMQCVDAFAREFGPPVSEEDRGLIIQGRLPESNVQVILELLENIRESLAHTNGTL